jgi:hypothetical protein
VVYSVPQSVRILSILTGANFLTRESNLGTELSILNNSVTFIATGNKAFFNKLNYAPLSKYT